MILSYGAYYKIMNLRYSLSDMAGTKFATGGKVELLDNKKSAHWRSFYLLIVNKPFNFLCRSFLKRLMLFNNRT